MKVLLAHPGTQYSHRLALELHQRNLLQAFHTGLAFTADGWGDRCARILPDGLSRRLANRRICGLPSKRLHTHPLVELGAMLQLQQNGDSQQVLHRRNEKFQQAISDTALASADAVIGFDTSAWILAERCAAAKVPLILDQSIGHPQAKERVYAELRRRFPNWAETIPAKSEVELNCEAAEHAAAFLIVVPSGFVRDTLLKQGIPSERIRVVPFGTDLDVFRPASALPPKPTVFLYAGTLTARKGVPVLLKAWEQAALGSRAELWLAGPGRLPESVFLPDGAHLLGVLSRAELAETMRRAHVFVFPSFFEGLAQVQIEALASGLPVIGTEASGAGDVVIPDQTGLVLPTNDIAALAEALVRLASNDDQVRYMRERCIATRELRSWQCYGEKWFQVLSEIGKENATH